MTELPEHREKHQAELQQRILDKRRRLDTRSFEGNGGAEAQEAEVEV
jgi:hypothetical protein